LHSFDFLFPELQENDAHLLEQLPDMPERLKRLGRSMEDPGGAPAEDAPIPAVYTYFGQFIDHDITLEVQPADLPQTESGAMPQLLAPDMTPLPLATIRNALRNFRTATLDLDNLYGLTAPRDANDGNKMRIGQNTALN